MGAVSPEAVSPEAVTQRYGVSPAAIADLLAGWGEPTYRARQVWSGLYGRGRPLEELTELPLALRARLAEALPLSLSGLVERTDPEDGTTKWLWSAADGAQVETVLMPQGDRSTVCVSSQAGCAMGCTFCATGQAGFQRHLTTGEVVEQVVRAAHHGGRPVTNVVFMGMGEPLANYDVTWSAIERLHDAVGISARKMVVSTVGMVPGIRRLAGERLPVTLAVSLHAADDELRDSLVPLNRRYPLAEVLAAARDYAARKGRRVSFEYALIAGVNDAPDQAAALAGLLAGSGSHVNLIPLNPTAGYSGAPPSPEAVERFAGVLRRGGTNATVRRNRGTTIDAACGQLRSRQGPEVGPGSSCDDSKPLLTG